MSFDIDERRREVAQILQSAAAGKTFAQFSYFSPKEQFTETAKMYYVNIQPFLILCFIVWLTILIHALQTESYMKKYGLMTGYSCLDIFMVAVQNLVLIYVFTLEENYVQYEMCYVYEMAVDIVPHVLFICSQWIKVCQAFQKYLILNKPLKYKEIFHKLSVGIFLAITIIVSLIVGGLRFLFIDFEKVVTIDKKTMKAIDICRHRFVFSGEVEDDQEYEFWFALVYYIVSAAVPFVLMLIFGISSIVALRKHVAFRKKFNVGISPAQVGLERLVKVTTAVTLSFAFLTLPNFMQPIMLKMKNLVLMSEYFSYMFSVLFMLNIPINFLMFSWQSNEFREKLGKILACLRRRRSSV